MSKLFKFRPIISMEESCELISRRTGEQASPETINYLINSGYLTRVFGYGQIIVGFSAPNLEPLLAGQTAPVAAESLIGVVSQYYVDADGVEVCQVNELAGDQYYFFKVKPNSEGVTQFKDEYYFEDLAPITEEDHSTCGFLYEEIDRIIQFANNEETIPPPPKYDPLLVRIEKTASSSRRAYVSELMGFETTNGTYSISPQAREALSYQASLGSNLDYRERESMERIILALAKDAGYNLNEPYKAAAALQAAAARAGVELPKSKDNIAGKLKAASRHDHFS